MITATWAALSMLICDILAVLLVQAESRNRASLSALLDMLYYPASLACTTIGVTALQGHQMGLKVEVIGLVELANAAGSFIAVAIGKRWVRNDTAARLAALTLRVADLERKLGGTQADP